MKEARLSHKNSKHETSQTYILHFDFISQYPQTVGNIVDYCRYELYKNRKDIKLAIVFSRMDQSTLMHQDIHPEIQAITIKSGIYASTLKLNDKLNNSTKLTVASVPKYNKSQENSEEESEEDEKYEEIDGIFAGLKQNWTEPMIVKGSESKVNITNMDSFSASGSLYSQASYTPNRIEVENYEGDEELIKMMVDESPLTGFKNRRHGRDCCFRFRITIIAFLKLAFLRSSLPPKYPLLNLSIMIILLFLDISAAMMLFLLYQHEAQFQITMIPFAFIYPFTIIISPLLA